MKRTAVFYGSTTGNTERIAETIANKLDADLFHISEATPENLSAYENLVLGTSTWGIGDLQDDWEDKIDLLNKVELENKKVAIFGLGDQMGYPDSFVDGMKAIYDRIIEGKGTVVGHCDTDGYDFTESKAVIGNKFIGLAVDEDSQSELTDQRVEKWTNLLKEENF